MGVAVVAALALLAATHTSVATTRSLVTPAQVTGWRNAYQQDLCMRQAFERAVPKGAVVYAGNGFGQPNQILLEAATLWAMPVPDRSAAHWIVSLKPGTGCFGYVLQAHRVS
jgi:hypothetical protein